MIVFFQYKDIDSKLLIAIKHTTLGSNANNLIQINMKYNVRHTTKNGTDGLQNAPQNYRLTESLWIKHGRISTRT